MTRSAATAPDLLGRYELLLRLGRGGMAELFLARLTAGHGFARFCAIKRILPHLADDPAFVAMFLNESRIAARLSHPHVCAVHELIEHDGERALAMEYLAGVSWDVLAAAAPRDRFGARLAASVLAQACDGLHYAHTFRGLDGAPCAVVHRDVSPQNLFVTTDGVCKVLDFGVSKVASDPSHTATGVRKGKLPYMAPEQLRGERVDPRADLWALGAVLFEALAGRRLFERATDFLTFDAILTAAIPGLADEPAIDPAVARSLGPIVERAVQRDVVRRYASAQAMADQLRCAAESLGGVLSAGEIAAAVREGCAAPLAARARDIAEVLGGWAPPSSTAPATSDSVVLRDHSLLAAATDVAPATIADHRAKRRAPWLAALALGGVAAGVVLTRDDRAAPVTVASAAREPPRPASAAPLVREPSPAASAPPPAREASPAASAPPLATAAGAAPRTPPSSETAAPPGSARPPAPRTSPPRPAHARAAAIPSRPGFYAVDSRPYATIFVDGAQLGDTPLFKIPLAAGAHTVRAVLADGRQRSFPIAITADQEARSVLAW